jgi:putative transcriptional regulator
MNTQIQKLPATFIIVGILILALVHLANSSPGAPSAFIYSLGHRMEASVSLQNPGGAGVEKDLAPGMFLVASRKLGDSNFRETVVLLIRYGQGGASGLVINRPLKVNLSTVWPDFKDSKHRNEALYQGGPVETNKMLLLVKSANPPQGSVPIFSDVYLSSSREELQRLIKSTSADEKFKIFAGYAGWAPGQLEAEQDRGDWHVLKADVATVFDKKSSEIWQELIHRITAKWVHLKIPDRSGVQRNK